jgi:ATPase subunit of ABC transporter with duplicated ATPase domains
MCANVIRLDNISLQHGQQILFIEASLALHKGEKVGLVGPNGSGKSTLFRCIMREETADEGSLSIDKGVTIGYFRQDVGEMQGVTVLEATLAGAGPVADVAHELKGLEHAMSDPAQADDLDRLVNRFGEVQARFDELGGYALEGKAREILAGLGFREAVVDDDVGALSGGWKMRVALARILLMQPDAMLLDEPTNHLDLESLIWLENYLKRYEGALLMTSHDREFLNRVSTSILEIDGGEITAFAGDYEYYIKQKALANLQQQATFDRQQAMLKKEFAFIERFKARASHAAQVQSRVKKLEKIDRVEPPRRAEKLSFDFKPAPRSGEDVVKIEHVNKAYGDLVVYKDFNFLLRRKERWCVMGVNGAGKSTLLKMIAGMSTPDAGAVTVGASVKLGYFAQHAMEVLDGEKTVWQTLVDAFSRSSEGTLRSLAGAFGFQKDEIDKVVKVLSGGEKARLVMALMLFDPPNLLVLDEPTNHLDLATKEMLIEALRNYEGSMLFVSHDRHFLAELSNRVLELTPEGPHEYGGGYTEYVARTGREAPGLH